MPTRDRYSYFVCPFCGAEVRVGTPGCPNCSTKGKHTLIEEDKSSESETEYTGGYTEDDTFDYETFLEREFGFTYASRRKRIRKIGKAVVATLLVAALAFLAFGLNG